jgi:hypothetical protein
MDSSGVFKNAAEQYLKPYAKDFFCDNMPKGHLDTPRFGEWVKEVSHVGFRQTQSTS